MILPCRTMAQNSSLFVSTFWVIMWECLVRVFPSSSTKHCCRTWVAPVRALFYTGWNWMKQRTLSNWIVVSSAVVVHRMKCLPAYGSIDWHSPIWGVRDVGLTFTYGACTAPKKLARIYDSETYSLRAEDLRRSSVFEPRFFVPSVEYGVSFCR